MKWPYCLNNHREAFKHQQRSRSQKTIERIHVDIKGPHSKRGIRGERYHQAIVDNFFLSRILLHKERGVREFS